ncbi:MAG: hypothetical protein ABSD85_17925 [Acidimicrobiales bacterium]|jgi:hypothetical protein
MNHNLKPWQVESFKGPAFPNFDEKHASVVGLYLHTPERLLVFSFDEQRQVQASIAQSSLPMTQVEHGP